MPRGPQAARAAALSRTRDLPRRKLAEVTVVELGLDRALSVGDEPRSMSPSTGWIGMRTTSLVLVPTTTAFDFKGQPTSGLECAARGKYNAGMSTAVATASLLDTTETFSGSSERDALGRVLVAVSPDGSEVAYGREHASDGTGQRTHEQLRVGPMRRYTQLGRDPTFRGKEGW